MSTHEHKEVGERLRRARKRIGKTQQDLADVLGIADRTYRNYESGQRLFPPELAARLRELSGVRPRWIYDNDGAMLEPMKGSDFLLASEVRDGDELPDYIDEGRFQVAAAAVNRRLKGAELDTGMALRMSLRDLIARHRVPESAIDDLIQALKDEVQLQRSTSKKN